MSNIDLQVADNLRQSQSKFTLRKESWSAALALIAWVCTLVAEHADQIPEVAGSVGQVVAMVASVAAFAIARFTVPAITTGQVKQLQKQSSLIGDPAMGEGAPVEDLPVYEGPTTNATDHS